MKTFFNDQHPLHHGRHEMFRGKLVPCVEVPSRADFVLQELRARGLGEVASAPEVDLAPIERVHARRYIDFLSTAWNEWVALDPANAELDALPSYWPIRTFRSDVLPASFPARMGLFSYDAGSPITSGTWPAARQGAACAVGAADHLLQGGRSAFVLTRPPGHHAGHDFFGGYCFVNNAAVAAQRLRDGGVARVAVLDIDYHHGNGTQAIFYERGDVFFASVHGDPHTEYPYYLGYADERGAGAGEGCNLNLPLPRGTGVARWREAMAIALQAIARFGADALVVSLGVDTFAGDPIAGFTLQSSDYLQVGDDLGATRLPTMFVFEGGYAVAEVGVNTVNVLEAFKQRAG
ncbi:histone deacetylase family protein [Ramlibacter sp. PS3R-8]|uniref:histone deacetylase family protein n=1 Tax=Ramlibacter sp. PS3R-8 TaxID=3133437 RepID=UPI0030A43084